MSGATHGESAIKQELRRTERRAKLIALVVVSILTALLVAGLLAVWDAGGPEEGTHAPGASSAGGAER